MTITCLQMDGVQIPAKAQRQGWAAIFGGGSGRPLGGLSGFRAGTPSNVVTVTSTQWTLNPCAAQIDNGSSLHNGVYGWSTDAAITGTINPADATYDRKDIIYIVVQDSSSGDGTGNLSANVAYTAGTPDANPVAPVLGSNSQAFLVATITVPKVGGGSPSVVVNPARVVASGGVLPVADLTARGNLTPYPGMYIHRLDVNREEWYDGTTWRGRGSITYNNTNFLYVNNTGGGSEIVVASINIPEFGVPYRVKVSGVVNVTASDTTTILECRARLDSVTGTVLGGVTTRPQNIPSGNYSSLSIGPGSLSGDLTIAHSVQATIFRPFGSGTWSVQNSGGASVNNALAVEVIFV